MRSWRSKPWLLWALLMVPAAATITGIGTYTRVLGPEDAPRPSRGDLVGRYEDGDGGVVEFLADGSAKVRGIEHNPYADESGVGKRCDAWFWAIEEAPPRWHHEVRVSGACGDFHPWSVDGPPSDPRLIHYAGDPSPDSRRVLTRR
ncbi:hypothetical protein ABZ615_08385 [Streptomyces sp. NPDC007325]|uniref:hypothetical protein n=1 Tax=Streptomyces sp. NPDC007325 TaxID=3154588 RepID=UPI0033D17699